MEIAWRCGEYPFIRGCPAELERPVERPLGWCIYAEKKRVENKKINSILNESMWFTAVGLRRTETHSQENGDRSVGLVNHRVGWSLLGCSVWLVSVPHSLFSSNNWERNTNNRLHRQKKIGPSLTAIGLRRVEWCEFGSYSSPGRYSPVDDLMSLSPSSSTL